MDHLMKRLMIVLLLIFTIAAGVFSQEEVSPVEIDGDRVEFDVKERKVIATGNVVITRGDVRLTADKIEFYRDTEIAEAQGNVVLERGGERVEGDNLVYNFKTGTGDFENPFFTAPPFYGQGKSVEKIGENHFRIKDGFITTSDWDNPESRVDIRTIDVYPDDVAVGRNMVFRLGNVPVFFWPRYTEDLKDRSSVVRLTPGYKSEWGLFLLSRWRFDRRSEDFKTFVYVDYRERLGLGLGLDNEYNTRVVGEGLIRTYYTHERDIGDFHFWESHGPVEERERYKAEWRHRWQIDERTMAISQYYKLSDSEFLKDYFEREYDREQNPNSYALITHAMPHGTLSGRADYRVNRFMSTVERLPEISYNLPNFEIFDSNIYWENKTTYSNLQRKNAGQADTAAQTTRVDFNNEFSYPMKIGFVEARPFVGGRHTYYSRTRDSQEQDVARGVFRTGADLSTKFYRIFDVHTDAWGLDINQLRHVITPSIAYLYQHEPTVTRDRLDQYDSVDALTRLHRATLSLQNNLQTKRGEVSVNLVRAIVSTDFAFTEDAVLPSSYNNVKFDLEITPYDWLGYYFDLRYNPQTKTLETLNFDLYINDTSDLWYVRLSDRYHFEVNQTFETEVGWKINPKWTAAVNLTYDLDAGEKREHGLVLRRDLHSWLMDMQFRDERYGGQEIMISFSLKGFDDVEIGVSQSFQRGAARRAGEVY